MYYAEQSNSVVTDLFPTDPRESGNVVSFDNPDSIFKPSERPGGSPQTVWVNFVDQLKRERLYNPDETLVALDYMGKIKKQLVYKLLTLPSTQKYIIEKHNIDAGRRNLTSSLIRGFNQGLFGDEPQMTAKDRGISLDTIKDSIQLLSNSFSHYVESYHDNGPAHFTTIKHKRFLEESFTTLTLTHLGLEKIISIYANPSLCEEVTAIPSDSLLHDDVHRVVSTEIDNLLAEYNQLTKDIAKSNMMLVVNVISKYRSISPDEKRDKANEGYLALIDSAKRFDISKKVKFSTHATNWIKYYLQCSFERTKQNSKRDNTYNDFFGLDLHNPEDKKIVISDTYFVTNEYVEGYESDIAIEDQNTVDQSLEEVNTNQSKNLIHKALQHLKAQQRFVIQMKYGIGVPSLSVKEIAKASGLTAERIRQIEISASNKIREFCKTQGVTADLL